MSKPKRTAIIQRKAAKKKPGNGKRGKGRPSLYKPEYADQAYEILSNFYCSEKQLAKVLGKSLDTIRRWKNDFPDFALAMKNGKDMYDTNEIKLALKRRATWHKVTETKTELIPILIRGKGIIYREKTTIHKKVIVPDTKAIQYWLWNRNPKEWGHPYREDKKEPAFNPDSPLGRLVTALAGIRGTK